MTTIKVHGLRDGQHTANTGLLTRQIKALGATVELARTGRVTLVTSSGERRVYALAVDFDTVPLLELEAARRAAEATGNSPLRQALADLRERP